MNDTKLARIWVLYEIKHNVMIPDAIHNTNKHNAISYTIQMTSMQHMQYTCNTHALHMKARGHDLFCVFLTTNRRTRTVVIWSRTDTIEYHTPAH